MYRLTVLKDAIFLIVNGLTIIKTNNYNCEIIAINRFVSFVNFHNRFDKALTKILQFRRALNFTDIFWTDHLCTGSVLKGANQFYQIVLNPTFQP